MRIIFSMEGGFAVFPGLNRPVSIGAQDLTEEERREVDRLLACPGVIDHSGDMQAPRPRGADYRNYTIVVEEAHQRRIIRATDPVDQDDLNALIALLRAKAGELRGRAPGR